MIRQINSLADIPEGEPRRYPSSQGYMRLRWRVGTGEHIECLEHRLVMRFPDGHVHHKNHDRMDNRRENLEVLSLSAHTSEHQREHRIVDPVQAVRMYEQGMSQPQIAAAFGVNSATVCRILQRAGQECTPGLRNRRDVDEALIVSLYGLGWGTRRIGKEVGVSATCIRGHLIEAGVTPRGPGRVPASMLKERLEIAAL